MKRTVIAFGRDFFGACPSPLPFSQKFERNSYSIKMKIMARIAAMISRRSFYHLVSGLAFMTISIACFFFLPGLARLFNVRLFSILLFGYALYRIIFFIVLFRKEQKTRGDRSGGTGV